MEKDFETEDFQFTPPEFDMALAGENVDTDTSFTAPSVENTLEEEVPFENPSLQVEVIPEPEVEAKTEENKSEQTFDDFDNVMPNPEDLTQFEVTQAEDIQENATENTQNDTVEIQDTVEVQSEDMQKDTVEVTPDENFDEAIPSFEPPAFEFEVIPEVEVEAKTEENKSEQTFDDFDNVMPNPEDLTQFEVTQAEDTVEAQPEEAQKDTAEIQDTVETQPEDAQDKIANAIREKMSEMQSPDTPDITESNEAAPSFEPVMEEEIQISPTPEPYQEEPVSKDEMFVEGKEKLKNMIANESQQSINLIKEDVLTK